MLAELLRPNYRVEMVASDPRPGELFPPLVDSIEYPVRRWYSSRITQFIRRASKVARRDVSGDLIIAVKPRLPSFGLALLARRQRPRPLILDIDDHELGLADGERRVNNPLDLLNANGDTYVKWLLNRETRADAITVSNHYLYRQFGGVWLPHARDAADFNPSPPPRNASPMVMFVGTWRPHKGVSTLVDAYGKLRCKSARLRIVGSVGRLATLPQGATVELPVSMAKLPSVLERADCIVIPSSEGAAAEGQLPGKLIDAMAAARPIVASAVGDIPFWLAEGAGKVVPADDPVALAKAIDEVLENPDRSAQMAKRARERFERFGASSVLRPRLCKLVEDLLNSCGHRPDLEPFGEVVSDG